MTDKTKVLQMCHIHVRERIWLKRVCLMGVYKQRITLVNDLLTEEVKPLPSQTSRIGAFLIDKVNVQQPI